MARGTLTEEDQAAIEVNPYALVPIVLEEVNDIRKVCLIGEGKIESLPKGVKNDAEQCVLARALSNGWHASIDEQIALRHESPGSVDFDAMRSALDRLGYRADVSHDEVDYDESEDVPYLRIEHTEVTAKFIALFDGGYYPDLVLNV